MPSNFPSLSCTLPGYLHAGIYVKIDAGVARVECRSAAAFAHSKHDYLVMVWAGGRAELSLLFLQMTTHLVFLDKHHPTPLTPALPTHLSSQNRVTPLNMDITGHFESASCVIEVDGSDTLAQVKGKLLAELGVPRARHVGVRMRGGGDIGNDDLRICDTEMDEGCAVELFCTGANITPGVIQGLDGMSHSLTLSPCDRYLAVMWGGRTAGGRKKTGVSIFDTETHERLCRFPCLSFRTPVFSPCSEWISCINKDTQCAEVHDVKTGALKHSFGDAGDDTFATAWSPCGTKLLSYCRKGLQVWDIATGVLVHEWGHILLCKYVMVVSGDRVATFVNRDITVWDYTTGVKVLVLTCPSHVDYVALTPNQRFIAACCEHYVRVWNIETGECVFENDSENVWGDIAVSNDIVAAHSFDTLCLWSISTGKQLLQQESSQKNSLAISSCGGVVVYEGHGSVEIVDISHLS